jgi:uncharacterized protein (DUF1810 family)
MNNKCIINNQVSFIHYKSDFITLLQITNISIFNIIKKPNYYYMEVTVPQKNIKTWGNLKRFHEAQSKTITIYQKRVSKPAIEAAFLDLTTPTKKGNIKKQGYWMWYTFPQIIGLGKSKTNIRYSIHNFKEGIKYLEDPILKKNLLIMTQTVLNLKKLDKIFGNTNYLKLRSSMTLFKLIAEKSNDDSIKLFTNACAITGIDIETIKILEKDPLYIKLSKLS